MGLEKRLNRLRNDPEFMLLAACCQPMGRPGRRDAIADRFGCATDHAYFLELVRAHRVAGLVEQGLAAADRRLPAPFGAELADLAGKSRIKMLHNAREELRLTEAFAQAGLAVYFIKGATLAQLAYGGVHYKTSWDIDMVTGKADVIAASQVLTDLGYRCDFAGDAAQLETFIARNYETSWKHPSDGHVIDLHAMIDESPRISAAFAGRAEKQLVEIATGRHVPTLSSPHLAIYLALHGTKHGWSRLKWLADFAALIDAQGLDRDQLRSCAHSLSLGSLLDMALHLESAFFGDVERVRESPHLSLNQRQMMILSIDKIRVSGQSIDDGESRAGWLANHMLHVRTSHENGELVPALMRRLMRSPDARRAHLPRWLLPIDALFVWAPRAALTTLLSAWRRRARS